MIDWNVIVTVKEYTFEEACLYMERFGPVKSTDYYNVLAMQVEDPSEFAEVLRQDLEDKPDVEPLLSHVIPVTRKVKFETPAEFEASVREVLEDWATDLAGKSFHVRVHRRGFKSKMSSVEEEERLGSMVFEILEEAGAACEVEFSDPDAVVAVEILDNEAGLSLWTREELKRYPFLGLD